ncbi:MAG: phenylacetate-CoA oxygenase, PaaJ subunit [Chitinophagaceae bacterium]|nr:phenylacetate-CoA oxygenase, PaaJ subunit [Chitinophagaceae bacterium]
MVNTITIEEKAKRVREILQTVTDPEVPVLTIFDLGIVRDIKIGNDLIEVIITPTYSGCPAMDVISMNIRIALLQEGFNKVKITQVLSPAWTTEWMSEEGKQKLKAYGIAPPQYQQAVCEPELFGKEEAIPCPRCNSYNTRLVSQFGSTACKALYQCNDCKEPFDYFKCH